jgi:hypothetical protein
MVEQVDMPDALRLFSDRYSAGLQIFVPLIVKAKRSFSFLKIGE